MCPKCNRTDIIFAKQKISTLQTELNNIESNSKYTTMDFEKLIKELFTISQNEKLATIDDFPFNDICILSNE